LRGWGEEERKAAKGKKRMGSSAVDGGVGGHDAHISGSADASQEVVRLAQSFRAGRAVESCEVADVGGVKTRSEAVGEVGGR